MWVHAGPDPMTLNYFLVQLHKRLEWALILQLLVGCDSTLTTPPEIDVRSNPKVEQTKNTNAISVLAWNLESGGNEPDVIAKQLAELSGYDIYCLCEVHSDNFERYKNALGTRFASVCHAPSSF